MNKKIYVGMAVIGFGMMYVGLYIQYMLGMI